MFKPVLACFLAALVASSASTQEPATQDTKRLTYSVKHGTAKDMAATLSKHFKGSAEILALPESPANVLLINGPAPVVKEITTLLEQVDRKPREVILDFWVLEIAPAAKDAEKAAPVELRELNGPLAQVLAKVEALKEKGVITSWKHIQGRALENKMLLVNTTEERQFVTSMNVTATGIAHFNYERRNLGTVGQMTVALSPDKELFMDMHFEHSRATYPEDSRVMGVDKNGEQVRSPVFNIAVFKNRVALRPGHAVAPEGITKAGRKGTTTTLQQTFLVVSAQLVPAEK